MGARPATRDAPFRRCRKQASTSLAGFGSGLTANGVPTDVPQGCQSAIHPVSLIPVRRTADSRRHRRSVFQTLYRFSSLWRPTPAAVQNFRPSCSCHVPAADVQATLLLARGGREALCLPHVFSVDEPHAEKCTVRVRLQALCTAHAFHGLGKRTAADLSFS